MVGPEKTEGVEWVFDIPPCQRCSARIPDRRGERLISECRDTAPAQPVPGHFRSFLPRQGRASGREGTVRAIARLNPVPAGDCTPGRYVGIDRPRLLIEAVTYV